MKQLLIPFFAIAFLLACTQEETKTVVSYDYSNYHKYSIKKLDLVIKLPKRLEKVPFNQKVLDSLVEAHRTQGYNNFRSQMISYMFTQKQGKVEIFSDTVSGSRVVISSAPFAKIETKMVKRSSEMFRAELEELNREHNLDMKLEGVKIGNLKDIRYARFITTTPQGITNSFFITKGFKSWWLYVVNDSKTDIEPILSSITFIKR